MRATETSTERVIDRSYSRVRVSRMIYRHILPGVGIYTRGRYIIPGIGIYITRGGYIVPGVGGYI